MLRRVLPAAAILATLAAAPAEGARPSKARAYEVVATAYWGPGPPPCGAVKFERVTLAQAQAGAQSNSPDIAAIADAEACLISIVSDAWRAEDDYMRCVIVAHELGHLYRRGHSFESRDIMAPAGPNVEFAPCVDAIEEQQRRASLRYRWKRAAGLRPPSRKSTSN